MKTIKRSAPRSAKLAAAVLGSWLWGDPIRLCRTCQTLTIGKVEPCGHDLEELTIDEAANLIAQEAPDLDN